MSQSSSAVVSVAPSSNAPTQDIDDFIYLMSHDVRASVRALLELPQWIAEDLEEAGVAVNGSVAQSIDLMNRHTARLDRMLVDLLAYSRIGRMQDVRDIDLASALDEVMGSLRVPDGVTFERHLCATHCEMGEQDILTLWSALIGNAIKHRDGQMSVIRASATQEGGVIRFTVGDDGPGIPENLRDRALNAMTTLQPRDEVEGTGMGLANVRKIATHYGGVVTLSTTSQGGRGLRVDVLLPRRHCASSVPA